MRTTPKHKIPYLTNQDKAADIAPQTRLVATFLEDKITDGSLRGPRGQPGVGVVPADEAVAGYVGADDSATRAMIATLTGEWIEPDLEPGYDHVASEELFVRVNQLTQTVQCRGLIDPPSKFDQGTTKPVMTLPRAAWPEKRVFVSAANLNQEQVTLVININGVVEVRSPVDGLGWVSFHLNYAL